VSEFISSLFEILNNDAMSQWIKWCNGGKALHVVDPQGFHANVSRIYWRQSSFGSFSRQLHMYGFKRTYEDVGTGQYKYFHESFQQSKREWLPLVSREVPPRKPYKRPLEEYRDSEAGGDDMHWAPQQAAVHRAAQLAALSHRLCHLECSVVSQLSLLQQKVPSGSSAVHPTRLAPVALAEREYNTTQCLSSLSRHGSSHTPPGSLAACHVHTARHRADRCERIPADAADVAADVRFQHGRAQSSATGQPHGHIL